MLEEVAEEIGRIGGTLIALIFVVFFIISLSWTLLNYVMGSGECMDVIAAIDSNVGELYQVDYINTIVFSLRVNNKGYYESDGKTARCTSEIKVPLLGDIPWVGDWFKFNTSSPPIPLRYQWWFGDPSSRTKTDRIVVEAGEKDVVAAVMNDTLVFIVPRGEGDDLARGINNTIPEPLPPGPVP